MRLVFVVLLLFFPAEPTAPSCRVLLTGPLLLSKPKQPDLLRTRLVQDELEVLQLALLVLPHSDLEVVRRFEGDVMLVLVLRAGSHARESSTDGGKR